MRNQQKNKLRKREAEKQRKQLRRMRRLSGQKELRTNEMIERTKTTQNE